MTFEQEEKNWFFPKEDVSKSAQIAQDLDTNSKIISILLNRGFENKKKIKEFLFGSFEILHNPFMFQDMQKTVERIRKAIDSKEPILVYGDRDVDGVTAVNVVVNTIRNLGGNAQWYVPADEGYGIHKDILTKYALENIKLLITVDCGISAIEEIEYAKTLGMEVILTDHHEAPYEGIPNAYTIIDPKTSDTNYPFKDIAGCSVALKTIQGLCVTYNKEYNKEITLCFIENSSFLGKIIKLVNGIEKESESIDSFAQIKQKAKESVKFYINNNELKDKLLTEDALLNEKIVLLESDDIDKFIEMYKSCFLIYNDKVKPFFDNNIDLCALGTIADSMPLVDENRVIVKEGLKVIEQNPNSKPGLGLLISDALSSKNIKSINARMISWNVTPVLNSSGRMGRGMLSAQLLMTKDEFQAKNLYSDIIKLNEDRRWLQYENIEQFNVLLKEQCNLEKDKAIILKASNLEHGVTGIVASQMVKAYSKPAFLLISDGKEATGAARSIEGFDIVAALESVKDILVKYGGHSQAAGFTVEHSKIDEFKKRILEYVDKNLKVSSTSDNIAIDCELKASDINVDFYKQLEILEPFGMGNARPVFFIKGVNTTEVSVFGNKSEHLRFKVSQKGSRNIQAVFWNKAKLSNMVRSENTLDIVFYLDMINKTDKEKVQLNVIDIKSSIGG